MATSDVRPVTGRDPPRRGRAQLQTRLKHMQWSRIATCAFVFVACGDEPSSGDDSSGVDSTGLTQGDTADDGGPSTVADDASGPGSTDASASAADESSDDLGDDAPSSTDEGNTTGEPGDVCSGPRPGPDTTGVPPGVVLRPSDSITVEDDGAVIEGLDIDGTITVLANDVTIRNVRITTGDYYPIRYFDNDNTGLLVEDTEIVGLSGNVTSAIAFANYTARRVNAHGMADGFKADSNVLIEDCWVHDLSNGEGEHNDGVQSTGGAGVTIRHSDLSGANNAAVQTGDEGAATEDLLIECSWLFGGGYTLNIRGSGDTVPVNTRILNNRFGRDAGYGPWTLDDPNPTVEGNVYDDDDSPIPYP